MLDKFGSLIILAASPAPNPTRLPFPANPIDTGKLGAGSTLLGNLLTIIATVGFIVAGLWIAWSLIRWIIASDLNKKKFWAINLLGGVLGFITFGHLSNAFGILGSIGNGLFV